MRVEILHIDDCPNWEEAGRRTTAALTATGHKDVTVTFRRLQTADDATGVPFAGRRWVVSRLAPIGASMVPRFVASSRIFEYLSQTRIHYWMTEHAKRDAHGRRGRVVGRRLPWNGDNFESLRSMQWQVHAYGEIATETVKALETKLGLPVTVFPEIRNRRLRNGKVYVIRPDGFVATIDRTR